KSGTRPERRARSEDASGRRTPCAPWAVRRRRARAPCRTSDRSPAPAAAPPGAWDRCTFGSFLEYHLCHRGNFFAALMLGGDAHHPARLEVAEGQWLLKEPCLPRPRRPAPTSRPSSPALTASSRRGSCTSL